MRLFPIVSLGLLAGACASAVADEPATLDPAQLIGEWRVDLRPAPDAPDYYQRFTLAAVDPAAGTFYGTAIENFTTNDNWGALHIAFTTSDGSGIYAHKATLEDGALVGFSHSVGRGQLWRWTAERVDGDEE